MLSKLYKNMGIFKVFIAHTVQPFNDIIRCRYDYKTSRYEWKTKLKSFFKPPNPFLNRSPLLSGNVIYFNQFTQGTFKISTVLPWTILPDFRLFMFYLSIQRKMSCPKFVEKRITLLLLRFNLCKISWEQEGSELLKTNFNLNYLLNLPVYTASY